MGGVIVASFANSLPFPSVQIANKKILIALLTTQLTFMSLVNHYGHGWWVAQMLNSEVAGSE